MFRAGDGVSAARGKKEEGGEKRTYKTEITGTNLDPHYKVTRQAEESGIARDELERGLFRPNEVRQETGVDGL